MQPTSLIAPLLLLAVASTAVAAPPKAQLIDHSSDALISAQSARSLLAEGIPAKVWKVYPASKWAFTSQVEGGLTANGTCVVTARVMMLPLTPSLKAVLFRPSKTATAFDAQAGSTAEQCRDLAKNKLKKAIESVVSSLVKA
ncbi:MAG: hypothetical protein IPH51_15530 [Rubrivivax sp.]|nr:hypothetical protein [Rubrivivax sp.]MBK8529009.1 hypothetical protein [Rubrivivax sp.]